MLPFRAVLVSLSLLSLLSMAGGAAARDDAGAAVAALAGKFLEAQRSFDLPAIRALTAENYVEVSPAGELDDREKMLGFYAPEKKTQAPPLTVDNELTRVYGDVGIQTVKLTYTMMAGGEQRKMTLRATLVAHRRGGEWKMVSAQYTGVRPP
ncbi:nuclear transport factor 2 family protein [Massilia sp. TWP1-3-3]|uniref:nuclear transport factor 2 family protein n=1 Tax=Massilia sp. TWP1-3-3 TaxID=2804573 RepID=UPI003CE93C90